MPDWVVQVAAIVVLFGGVFGAVNGYRSMKRSSPIEEIRKELSDKWERFYNEKWDRALARIEQIEDTVQNVDSELTRRRFDEIDAKLDNDNRRIKMLIDANRNQQRFLVLLLKAQQQTLVHLSEGNHKGNMKEMSDEIQEFLLSEVTRCDYE